ncbi:MAG: peptidylprolyl isomerase [Candidatus Auribacterota bacterium]|jgi:peptidyl-prolyl cis-trans isomerase D|nr:peptidylprolyl isomerase [Candidatus Auribacterota bacterium]
MLTFFRKKMKLMFAILLVGIIPAFTLWGIGSLLQTPAQNVQGEINGRKVLLPEYRREQLAVMWDALFSNRTLEPAQVNDATWNRLILLDEAKKYGIVVSDEEVADRITRIFQRGGQFDKRFYIDVLTHNRITPAGYEEATRNSIKIERLRDLILGAIKITEDEFEIDYQIKNTELIVDYVIFPFGSYRDRIEPTDEEIIVFFEENKDDYRKPAEVNVKYIQVALSDFLPLVTLSEEDARIYYEENIDRFKEEKQVHARHILLKVPETADEAMVNSVKERADEILEKAKAGEDFAELAMQYSEGPTAPNGGDLGFFGKGSMVQPFEDAAFSIVAGEIFPEPVKTRFGFHIIKVEEVKDEKINEFDDIKQEVIDTINNEKADELARESIKEVFYQSDDLESMIKAAVDLKLEVRETGFFSTSYNIPGIGTSSDFHKAAFDVDLFNVSDIIKTDSGYAIACPVERRSGVLPDLAEVKERVIRDYKAKMSTELAKADAKVARAKIVSKMQEKNISFEDAVTEIGLDPMTSAPFVIDSGDPAIGYGLELGKTLFAVPAGTVSEPIDSGKGFVIVKPVEYKKPVISDIAGEELEQKKQQLAFQKKYMVFQEWMEAVKKNAQLLDFTIYAQD